MDIPMEQDEHEAAQVVPDFAQRALKSANDDGELWLINKKLVPGGAEEPITVTEHVRFKRTPKGKVHMGHDWVRVDGEECKEVPTHIYVVGKMERYTPDNQGGGAWA